MVVYQALLESVSRCFGSECANGSASRAPNSTGTNETPVKGNSTENAADCNAPGNCCQTQTSSVPDNVRSRVLKGLELKNHEFDALFTSNGNTNDPQRNSGSPKSNSKEASPLPETEINIAQVVAKARRAARPEHHRTMVQDNIIFNTPSTPKSAQSAARSRMRAEKRKADIFRMRPGDQFYDPVRHGRYNADKKKNHSSSGASGLFNSKFLTDNSAFAQVLCFANPVRGNSQEDEKDPAIDNSDYLSNDDDTNTLNTCEDTITSTLAYEAQFSHMVESRPPMPLFMHFQVPCEEDHQNNELTKIVTTGSHRSFNLWQVIHSEVPEAPSTPLKSNNSPNKSSPVHIHHNIDTHDRVDVTPNSRTKSRSIEHTTPMIIVDPQVKHHPKKSHGNNTRQQNHSHVRARPPQQQSPSSSTNSAPSTPKQHWQRLPVIISPSSSQDANHQQQEEEESQELSPTSFDQSAPATPTAYRKAISKSSSSSSTASSSSDETRTSSASSSKRIDGITVNIEKRMRRRNEPVIISPSSTPRNKVSPKHGNHVSIKTPSTATSSPHDSLPHMLKLRNSSNSISPTTPVCSTSRSTSLEGLSSSTHSVSPQKVLVSPGGDGEGSSSVTHRVAV